MFDLENVHERRLALIRCSRQYARAIGLGVAALGLAGGWSATLGLINLPDRLAWLYALVATITLLLVGGGVWGMARAQRLPLIGVALRDIWRALTVVVVSLVLSSALTSALLSRAHAEALTPVVITILVGLHCIPLARLFYLPLYQQTGLWLVALALSTWAFVPSAPTIGAATIALWPIVLGLGGSLILWISAGWSLMRLAAFFQDAITELEE